MVRGQSGAVARLLLDKSNSIAELRGWSEPARVRRAPSRVSVRTAEIQRQAAGSPFQESWMNRPEMLVVWIVPFGDDAFLRGSTALAADFVVAVSAASDRGTPVEKRGRSHREDHPVHGRFRQHIVSASIGLHAELQLMRAGEGAEPRAVRPEK